MKNLESNIKRRYELNSRNQKIEQSINELRKELKTNQSDIRKIDNENYQLLELDTQ